MRSNWKMFLTTMVVVLSVSAVAGAGAAAAPPEFVIANGKFPDAHTGKTGEVTLQTPEKIKGLLTVKCKESSNIGEMYSFSELAKVVIKYTGCKAKWEQEQTCTTKGKAAGEIVTNSLTSTLVYTNKAAKEVGTVSKPESGTVVAEYVCKSTLINVNVKLTGGVIAKLPNEQVNKTSTSFTWNLAQKAGIQEPTEYDEPGTEKKLSASLTSAFTGSTGGEEKTGEQSTETQTWATGLEVKA